MTVGRSVSYGTQGRLRGTTIKGIDLCVSLWYTMQHGSQSRIMEGSAKCPSLLRGEQLRERASRGAGEERETVGASAPDKDSKWLSGLRGAGRRGQMHNTARAQRGSQGLPRGATRRQTLCQPQGQQPYEQPRREPRMVQPEGEHGSRAGGRPVVRTTWRLRRPSGHAGTGCRTVPVSARSSNGRRGNTGYSEKHIRGVLTSPQEGEYGHAPTIPCSWVSVDVCSRRHEGQSSLADDFVQRKEVP